MPNYEGPKDTNEFFHLDQPERREIFLEAFHKELAALEQDGTFTADFVEWRSRIVNGIVGDFNDPKVEAIELARIGADESRSFRTALESVTIPATKDIEAILLRIERIETLKRSIEGENIIGAIHGGSLSSSLIDIHTHFRQPHDTLRNSVSMLRTMQQKISIYVHNARNDEFLDAYESLLPADTFPMDMQKKRMTPLERIQPDEGVDKIEQVVKKVAEGLKAWSDRIQFILEYYGSTSQNEPVIPLSFSRRRELENLSVEVQGIWREFNDSGGAGAEISLRMPKNIGGCRTISGDI